MARPLRLQFDGAIYHVTSRGNARDDIFEDDRDRHVFLECLQWKIGSGLVSCKLRPQSGRGNSHGSSSSTTI